MPILVRDLGTLSYAHQEPEGILGKDNNPDTIEGIVELLKYAECIEGHRRHSCQGGRTATSNSSPQDVHIVPYIDRGDLVDATVTRSATR